MTSSGVIIIDGDAKHLDTPSCKNLAAVIPDAPEQVTSFLPQYVSLPARHCGNFNLQKGPFFTLQIFIKKEAGSED